MPSEVALTFNKSLQSYDPDGNIICIRDGDVSLLVDVSLCLSPFKTYPWLREPNTVVMALGYLEKDDEHELVSSFSYFLYLQWGNHSHARFRRNTQH